MAGTACHPSTMPTSPLKRKCQLAPPRRGTEMLEATKNRLADLGPSYLHAAPPVAIPHVASAFPLLDGEDY